MLESQKIVLANFYYLISCLLLVRISVRLSSFAWITTFLSVDVLIGRLLFLIRVFNLCLDFLGDFMCRPIYFVKPMRHFLGLCHSFNFEDGSPLLMQLYFVLLYFQESLQKCIFGINKHFCVVLNGMFFCTNPEM